MKNVVIFGAADFADVAHYYFLRDSPYRPVAFTVDKDYVRETSFQGLPVVPFEDLGNSFSPQECALFVAVGIRQVNRLRAQKVAEAEAKGYRLASYVSSKAIVPSEFVALPNTFVLEQSVLQGRVSVGRNSVLWSARIGFGSRVGDHCWLAGPLIGDMCHVSDYSFVGPNATVAPGVTVGESNVIGAGALILRDTKNDAVCRESRTDVSQVPSHRFWTFGR